MKSKIMPTAILGAICLIVALLLSAVNLITAPIIEQRQRDEANKALLEVLPDGIDFEEIDITSAGLSSAVTAAYAAESGGYVFQLTVTGYKPGLVIMCGVNPDGTVSGVKHIATAETFGVEGELDGAYVGKNAASLEEIIAYSGSTPAVMTSAAYYTAIDAALSSYATLKGGN